MADPVPNGGDPVLYEGSGLVLQEDSEDPKLCLGGILLSLPPQCGGLPLIGWDWDLVAGEDSAGGSTWGSYHVVGTYDGTTFTLVDVTTGGGGGGGGDGDHVALCPRPEGGWKWPDRDRATWDDFQRAADYAESRASFSAVWVKYAGNWRRERLVFGAAFTVDPKRFVTKLKTLWGGPLCLHQFAYTELELKQFRRDVEKEGGLADQLGLQILWSGDDVTKNRIEIGVVIYTPEQQAALEAVYGPEVIKIFPALRPVTE